MKQHFVTIGHTLEGKSPIKLDVLRLAETRLLVQASSGGGKSYTLRRILEATHGKVQHLVLDPEGEFSSLRKAFDYVYVAKGEKTEPDPRTAGTLAQSLLKLGVSAIIDIYELHPRERRKFVRYFLESLVDSPKALWHPTLVVLDEAHEYAPEQSESEALDAVIALASKGRKRDFACVLATQRPAKLNKDVAAECQNKLIGLANLDIDRKRAGDELGFRGKEEFLQLRDLDPGEIFALGPAFRIGDERVREPVKMTVDPVITPHGRTARRWRPTRAATSKQVKAALSALAELPKQAEQELKDKESMIARIRELEREARELRKGQPKSDPDALKRSFEEGRQAVMKEVHKMSREMRTLKNQFITKLKELGLLVEKMPDGVDQKADLAKQFVHTNPPPKPLPPAPVRTNIRMQMHADGDGPLLGKSERLILKFLALRPDRGFSAAQVGAMTGFKHSGGAFNTYLSRLRTAGLITGGRDGLRCVDSERAAKLLGDEYAAPERAGLEDWLNRLGGGEKKIYQVVFDNPDHAFTKEELGEHVQMQPSGGSFNTYLSRLSTLGLIQRNGSTVRLNPEMLGL